MQITANCFLKGAKVNGDLTLTQSTDGGDTTISGKLTGLEPNSSVGFHVHEYGDLSDGCKSCAGHFNPHGKEHGAPTDENRHIGDLGNIQADDKGEADLSITDSMVSLTGQYSVIGRAIVVHAGTDDLGQGGFDDSKTTGHAGARAACGVIGIAKNPEP
eukprot:235051_1